MVERIKPLKELNVRTVLKDESPTNSDSDYSIPTIWIDQSTGYSYMLVSVSNDGIASWVKFSSDNTHPSRRDCVILSNQLANRFSRFIFVEYNNENDLDYALIDFFEDYSKVESKTNIVTENIGYNKIILDSTSTVECWDSCDSLDNWSEYEKVNEGELSLDYDEMFEDSTASILVSCTSFGGPNIGTYRYSIQRTVNPKEDWSSEDHIIFWVKSSKIGSKIELIIENEILPVNNIYYHTFSTTEWECIRIDLSTSTKNDISNIYFKFTREEVAYTVNIDSLSFDSNIIYSENGVLESITKSSIENYEIFELLAGIYATDYTNTEIIIDLSLDGGNHWLSDIGLLFFERWLSTESGGVLEKADGNQDWDNKSNIKLRIKMSTNDTSITPSIDDYAIIWRVKKI